MKHYCDEDYYAKILAQGVNTPFSVLGTDVNGNARLYKAPQEFVDNFTTPRGNQSVAPSLYRRFTFDVSIEDQYLINWDYIWSLNNTTQDIMVTIDLDGTSIGYQRRTEPKDSGGPGIVVTNINGGTFNSGTNQRMDGTGGSLEVLSVGSHNLDFMVSASQANHEATIYRNLFVVKRLLGV